MLYSCGVVAVAIVGSLLLAPLGLGLTPLAIKAAIVLAVAAGAIAIGIVDPSLYRQLRGRRAGATT